MPLKNSYQSLPSIFFAPQNPEYVENPECVLYNTELAKELEISDFIPHENAHNLLSGNILPEGAKPVAQAYAGHQFGHPNMLGDGRAVLLGEWQKTNGKPVDIVLKGSGRTAFSRGGDGRATLYSMLREYLISEAMHGLKIPTSRSLAVVTTGETVFRETLHDGAILTRVMDSHIRVGTFEFAKAFATPQDMKSVIEYTIQRLYPKAQNPQQLLEAVVDMQTSLVTDWLRVGFIHGVMNTDNTSISGETFDYGPCAFMNSYHPDTVFSSIDTAGRYSFQNQSKIIAWNLSVLGNTLSDVIDTEILQKILLSIPEIMEEKWNDMMCQKLGIIDFHKTDRVLFQDLLDLMQEHKLDYTNTFVYISGNLPGEISTMYEVPKFQDWINRWESRVKNQEGGITGAKKSMQQYNPVYIPRNHLVENVLEYATAGNMEPFQEFLKILKNPYTSQDISLKYMQYSDGFDEQYQTFCGT